MHIVPPSMTTSSRSLSALVMMRTIESISSSAMLPFIVIWAHDTAGMTGAAAGLLFAVEALGEMSAGLIGGTLSDHLGRRRVLLVSLAGMSLSYGALAFIRTPIPAIAFFLIAGVFESAFHPSISALVTDLIPNERLISAFGSLRIGANVGKIVGPLLGAIATLISLRAVFAVSGLMLSLCLIVGFIAIPRSTAANKENEPEIPSGTLHTLYTDSVLLSLVAAGGLLAISFTWWESDGLVLLRQQTQLSETAYAGLFTIAAVTIVVFQFPATHVIAKLRTGHVLLIAGVLQAVGLSLLLLSAGGYAILIVAVMLMACGEMLYSPTASTIIARRAPKNQRTLYQAAFSLTEDIGAAIGPTTGLLLAQWFGAILVWILAAVISLASGVIAAITVNQENNVVFKKSD